MADSLVRVGRWMSDEEFAKMIETGMAVESRSGTTHVAFPADRRSYEAQAAIGSVYIEFDVPSDSIRQTQLGWAKILGPNTLEARLARRRGEPVPEMPPATNIVKVATKS